MENDSWISRREFLKRFAILSIASAGGLGCVCVPVVVYGPPPEPEYGPPPVEGPLVRRMTYLAEDGSEIDLYGSMGVSLNAQFLIYFSAAMTEASQNAVSLSDADGGAVSFEPLWSQMDILKVVPAAELQPGTRYILEVGGGAEGAQGDPFQWTESARAEFLTAEL
jgi:hypothetical protein